MDITLGVEVALSLHLPSAASYADLETALVDAGFTDYTIMRTANTDGTGDAQLSVRAGFDEQTSTMRPLPAGDTLEKLREALTALQEGQPGEPPA